MPYRPAAVAFDVIETLMPLEPLRARIEEVGQPPHVLELWFTRTLRDGIALAATGDYRTFAEVAANALRAVTRDRVGDAGVAHVLAGFGELPAYSDAAPAMAQLADAGVRVACLTNGSRQVTEDFVARTGLGRYVERVIPCEEIGSWKPPAAVYLHAADVLGLPPAQVALVAVHAWDCHGAKRAGLTTGWAARLEGRYADIFEPPDVTGADLVDVAEYLLALPAG